MKTDLTPGQLLPSFSPTGTLARGEALGLRQRPSSAPGSNGTRQTRTGASPQQLPAFSAMPSGSHVASSRRGRRPQDQLAGAEVWLPGLESVKTVRELCGTHHLPSATCLRAQVLPLIYTADRPPTAAL